MKRLRRPRWVVAVCGLAMIAATLDAQVEFSALVDLVLNPGLDIGDDTGDSDSNAASRGDDPFHTIRARLFMDGDVAEWLSVNTRFLFDHDASSGQPIARLDGAFATFWSILGVDALNLQVGNVPWPFGSFGPRTYSDENPVIGAPLMYSYQTQVHGGGVYPNVDPDSTSFVPHNLSEHMLNTHGCDCFLEQAGETVSYQGRGLIPIYDSWWTNGVVLVGAIDIFDYAFGVTTGALSNPKAEGNGRPSYVGRVGVEPFLGISAGVSGFWGPYLSPEAAAGNLVRVPPPSDGEVYDFGQAAVGADLNLLFGPFSIFAEGLYTVWQVPNVVPDFGLWSWFVEARYDVLPRMYVAARYDHMIFDRVDFQGSPTPWDHDVWRVEPAVGIRLARGAVLKVLGQATFRAGPAGDTEDYLIASQLSLGI